MRLFLNHTKFVKPLFSVLLAVFVFVSVSMEFFHTPRCLAVRTGLPITSWLAAEGGALDADELVPVPRNLKGLLCLACFWDKVAGAIMAFVLSAMAALSGVIFTALSPSTPTGCAVFSFHIRGPPFSV